MMKKILSLVFVASMAWAQEQARLNFEAQEALKREELIQRQQQQTEEEKKKAKAQAKFFAVQAAKDYRAGKYQSAAANFQKAYELDPENDAFLYNYGVTLYKVGNYNKSLVVLSMAEDGEQNPLEHRYYVALNHLKLNELDKALENFGDIQEERNVELSPSAAFYAGTIEFQKALYPKAKERYQFVLDNSKDPKLDKQAEAKIEEIDRIEMFIESQKEILRYNLYTGLQYDGNVLNIATQNLATNSESFRLLYGGSATYYYYRTMKSKYALELAVSDMYSVDKNFKRDSTIQSADPLQYGLRLPVNYSHSLFKKSFNSNVTPYTSMLNMSDEAGVRKQILNSTGLALDTQWDQGNDKFHILKFDYVLDKSSLEVSNPDDDLSARRMSFNYSWMKLLNLTGEKSVLADIGYVTNASNGKNNTYAKIILAGTYSFLWSSKYRGSARLDYSDLKYSENPNSRKDTIYGLTLGAAQDLNEKNNIALTISYLMNNSNVESYKYNKIVLGFIYFYSDHYLRK